MSKATCRWPECERPADGSNGFCVRDYGRARRVGDMEAPWKVWRDTRRNQRPNVCRWPECDRPVAARGFCTRDFRRAQTEGDYETPWLTWRSRRERPQEARCRWPDCEDRHLDCWGFCRRHYQRARAVGDRDEPWLLWRQVSKCTVCGKTAAGRIRGMRFCSDRCRHTAWYNENADAVQDKVRRRRALKASTQVEPFTVSDVRLRRGDDCYLCGERINFKLKWPHPQSPSLDHVVPLSRGGTHTLDNAAMTHLRCNQSKNARDAHAEPISTLLDL